MNVYLYIAMADPMKANKLCEQHGYYQTQTYDDLAYCLENIVATNGEAGLKQVMDLHPERDAIIELNTATIAPVPIIPQTTDTMKCPCEQQQYMNQTGVAATSGLANQTNEMILVAAMIVSIAIISMKK